MTVSISATTTLLEDLLVESSTLAAGNAPSWSALSSSNSNYGTPSQLGAAIVSTPEASIAEHVFRLYEALQGHAPDSAGMQSFVAQAEAGLTPAQISVGDSSVSQSTWNTIVWNFMNTSDYQARFPIFTGAQATTLTVLNLYGQILQRAPSSTELAYYVNELNTGTTLAQVLQQFTNSPEYINDTKSQIDASLLNAGLSDVKAGSSATYHYSEIAFGHGSGGSSASTTVVGLPHAAASAHFLHS